MDFFQATILIVLAWTAGMATGRYLAVQVVRIISFDLPFSLKLLFEKALTSVVPVLRYVASVALLLVTIGAASGVIWHYLPAFVQIACLGGFGIVMLIGIRRCGRTSANLNRFVATNRPYIKSDAFNRTLFV